MAIDNTDSGALVGFGVRSPRPACDALVRSRHFPSTPDHRTSIALLRDPLFQRGLRGGATRHLLGCVITRAFL